MLSCGLLLRQDGFWDRMATDGYDDHRANRPQGISLGKRLLKRIPSFASVVYMGTTKMTQQERPIIPVLLSGGAGSRLWPLSREAYPKQLLTLLGEQTLLNRRRFV